ncbi:cytochrome c biosynthesis protein [Alicyclobacillus hesperidum]|uniref:Cytochrome c biogenesis protein CcdA n=1 Tax=Alicyclobacillus hesperidum TaxID=89784 RepID=A0A1H2RXK5_9BACL|nr:cytochrome c biogenesis protein CcdA [Alicyclobacillus hesperidum]GLV13428.1 cytochrome c biosynthesis protein [Alicyclobacillus hesperidum]SDW24028.1 Cytochrome c biogenesis protein CcdA [Alicyclobacillus hesperidum]
MNAEVAVVLGAGMMAAFNPCGVAMLPSYIVHLIAGRERGVWDGVWAGLLMTAGFLIVFLLAGVIAVTFATVLGKAVAWIAEVVGVAFVLLGILMLFGKRGLEFHIGGDWNLQRGSQWSVFLYGIAYALGSLGCTLPLFSVLVLSSFHSQGFASGMSDFVLYALGMGLVVTIISLASTISQQLVGKWVRSGARWMGRLSALMTLGTGVYLVIYWFPYVRFYAGF